MRYLFFLIVVCYTTTAISQETYLSLGGGVANSLNYETIGEQGTMGSGSFSYTRTFLATSAFVPVFKSRLNFSAQIQTIDSERHVTNMSFLDFYGGVRHQFTDRLSGMLAAGPFLTMQAKNKDSDYNYIDTNLFHQVGAKANLSIGYSISPDISFHIEETMNITNLQNTYNSVDQFGNLFERKGGLQLLTSELCIYFNL